MRMKFFPAVSSLFMMMALTVKNSHLVDLKTFCNDLPDGNYLCPNQTFLGVCACSNQFLCDTNQWYDPQVGHCHLNEDLLHRLIQCLNVNSTQPRIQFQNLALDQNPVSLSEDSSSSACTNDCYAKQLKDLKESLEKLNDNILYIREILAGKATTCSSYTPTDTTIATTGTSTPSGTTFSMDTNTPIKTSHTYIMDTNTTFDPKSTAGIHIITTLESNFTQSVYSNSTTALNINNTIIVPTGTTTTSTESITGVSKADITYCPDGFYMLNGTEGCYQIIPKLLTWDESRAECQHLHRNSHLVAVLGSSQNEAIVTFIKDFFRGTGQCNITFSSVSSPNSDDGFFTSGQRSIPDNCKSTFQWKPTVGAEFPMGFYDWDDGEPNCYGGYETCVHYRCDEEHCHWNDYPCEYQSCPICHIERIN